MLLGPKNEPWPALKNDALDHASENFDPFKEFPKLPLTIESSRNERVRDARARPSGISPPDFIAAPGTIVYDSRPKRGEAAATVQQAERGWPVAGSKTVFMIAVNGASSDKGTIRIAIYDKPEGFNDVNKAIFRKSVRVEGGSGYCPMLIESLPARFAVAAYHDANDNGVLDSNYLNIPQESYGFTNRARGLFGPPPYQDAQMDCPPPGTELRVEIR